ncbi:MAG: hypothetical protein NTX50_03335 [Candidatus Sumerlaeota bacterium]|nr:hypothetical protein [Candidatus Sumerlaeota bacterium]
MIRALSIAVALSGAFAFLVGATSGQSSISVAGPQAAPSGIVNGIKVLPDKAPDCASLKTIAETVTRGCRNNDEKAIAVYNFMQLTQYHRQYPSEPGGIPVLKEINCYGWSLCGGLHSEQSAIWRELGWDWRFVGWSGHTTVEAKYDDRWHYLDVFLKFYAWAPDGKGGRTIAGEDELNSNAQELIQDAFVMDKSRGCVYMKDNPFAMNGAKANWRAPEFLACGDTIADVIGGLKTHRGAGRSEGWAAINHASGGYSADVNLAPGFCLENTWDPMPDAWYWAGQKAAPAHTCSGHKDTRNDPGFGLILEPYINSKPARSYANGILSFSADFANDTILSSFASIENVKRSGAALAPAEAGKPAAVIVNLSSPYIITKAKGEAAGAEKAEVSVDGGKTFKAVEMKDFSPAVKGQTAALLKVTFAEALKSLKIEAVVQNNPGALPYLSPGKNVIAVSVTDPKALGNNKLVVTYAYRLGLRAKSFEQLCDQGKEIAKQHDATWSGAITCVQKTFAAKDLPATFEIDCPTPKGRYPVYPRMMFLRREVVAPDSQPQPLPAGAQEAKAAPDEELLSLPNPFLVGTETPPPVKTRPVRTVQIPLTYSHYVSEKGEVSDKGTLRWPKVQSEEGKVIAGAIIITGDLKALPSKGINAVRLLVPVAQGHNQAATKLGVVFLKKPVESGKACNVKELAEAAATTIIPKQPADAAEYKPAKMFAIDVTRAVKAVASGEMKFNGLALRIVPDRATDEGWTVRCDVSPSEKIYLEVDVNED